MKYSRTIEKVVATLLLLIVNKIAFCQIQYFHSIGAGYYGRTIRQIPVLNYSCRLNFINIDSDQSISIGTHLGFWAEGNTNYSRYFFDAPIVAELHFGHGATQKTISKYGGSLGFGYGINNSGTSYKQPPYSFSNHARGPVFVLGLR